MALPDNAGTDFRRKFSGGKFESVCLRCGFVIVVPDEADIQKEEIEHVLEHHVSDDSAAPSS
jgi:hypothetical protein